MASIDLPRALQDYFAFAETTPTRNGRRFSITLPYCRPDGRLDRLQWWYHLSAAKEMALGDSASETMRTEAIERFITHIERWLLNTRQDLYGNGSIPYVSAEGNRVVGSSQVDPAISQGLEPNVEDDSPDVDGAAPGDESEATAANEAAESGDGSGATPESGHRSPNRSAFG
ncbi:MAG: hypothetical protein JSR66_03720 [Proteobacteria bacterium]|nr:hypothetical protein [Pseudomonadota bacterium]